MAMFTKEMLTSCRILIVDDMDYNLFLLGEMLHAYGFSNIIFAQNGQEALDKTRELQPDLVILDLMMPEMDGFEYCRRLRSQETQQDLPVLVQTALTIPGQKTRAFEAGATDFVTKPVDKEELIARTLLHLERHKLQHDLRLSLERMVNELNDARKMQDLLMPNPGQLSLLEDSYHLHIHSHFEPSSELGGDFWGILPISDTSFGAFIADFSGHGVTAAINTFRLHTLIKEHQRHAGDPSKFLSVLNNSLTGLLPVGQFATMFYGVIDIAQSIMHYASAASTAPIIINAHQKKFYTLDGSGLPLGILKNTTYPTRQSPFCEYCALFLYSDALIETEEVSNHKFMKEKTLLEFFQNAIEKENIIATDIFQALLSHFRQLYHNNLQDDLTLTFYARKLSPLYSK